MVKANELRIGNWLADTGSLTKGYYHTISAIESDIIFFGSVALSPGNCGGIPVTAEILEKCGFLFNHYLYTWDRKGISLEQDEFTPIIHRNFQRHEIAKPPKYLHQLQNLYFALTGEELTVNL